MVKPTTQTELQDTRGVDLGLHAGLVRPVLSPARRTTRPHDELADASSRRTFATRGYACEALVAVGMPIEDDVGMIVVERTPEGLYLGAIVAFTGSVERVLEVSQRAPPSVAVVSPQPAALGGVPVTPPTSSQLLFRATMCQAPRSYE